MRAQLVLFLSIILAPLPALSATPFPWPDISQPSEPPGPIAPPGALEVSIPNVSVLIQDIHERYGDRLAMLYLAHEPEFHMVVRLLGEAPVADELYEIGEIAVRVVFEEGAQHTPQELRNLMMLHRPAVAEIAPNLQLYGPDDKTGEIQVGHPPGQLPGEDVKAMVESIVGAPLRFEEAKFGEIELPILLGPISLSMGVAGDEVPITRSFPDLNRYPRPPGVGVVDNSCFEGPVSTVIAPPDAPRPAGVPDDYDGRFSDTPDGWVDISPVVLELRAEFGDRMAGLYVEPGNETHVFVRLAGDDPVADRAYEVGSQRVEVEFTVGQPHTLTELQAVLTRRWDDIVELLPTAHAHYADEITGALIISVDPGDAVSLANADALADELGVPVAVREETRASIWPGPEPEAR